MREAGCSVPLALLHLRVSTPDACRRTALSSKKGDRSTKTLTPLSNSSHHMKLSFATVHYLHSYLIFTQDQMLIGFNCAKKTWNYYIPFFSICKVFFTVY